MPNELIALAEGFVVDRSDQWKAVFPCRFPLSDVHVFFVSIPMPNHWIPWEWR